MNSTVPQDPRQRLLFPVPGFGKRKEAPPPPAHRDVDTSQAAAAAAAPRAASRREIALGLITAAGDRGLSNYEVASVTGWPIQSVTPLANRLARDGLIKDSGQRRLSPCGVSCKVWVAEKESKR